MNSAIIEAQNRIKSKRNLTVSHNNRKKPSNYISNLFTRTLISVILVLACSIFVNLKDENLLFFKDKLFNNTLAFTKINELYTKYFGEIVPPVNTSAPVFNNEASILSNLEPLGNSFQGKVDADVISYIESGIVVFAGVKENYGETVIVQGIDGVDIWYSNLTNVNVTMYDYVEKDAILGEVKDKKIVLTFMEQGEFIGYDKYIS